MLSQDQIEQARKVDVLALAARYTELKRVAGTGGGEYAGPCPICGGRDRFHVQPGTNRWFCRYCTGGPKDAGWHDAIELQMRFTGDDFVQAVESLTGTAEVKVTRSPMSPSRPARPAGPPDEKWKKRGMALVERAQEALWGQAGSVAIEWQEHDPASGKLHTRRLSPQEWLAERGLSSATLHAAQIGFIPASWQDNPARWGMGGQAVYLPQGILIPSVIQGELWSLKIRRPAGKPKYTQVRGGRPAIYLADTLRNAPEAACITEGELDALLLWQCLLKAANPRWRRLGVITLGSNSNYLTLERWARYLYPVKHFLLLYDQDGKSQAAIRFWEGLSARTRVIQWRNLRPGDKDLTDYHRSGGRLLDLVSWAVTQIDYENRCELHPGDFNKLEFVAEAASQNLPETEPADLPGLTDVQSLITSTPEPQEITMTIEEAVDYARAHGLRIKFVEWPKGAPRPTVEFK